MYKNILVPIDLSHPEPGQKTLQIAREIGGKDARITALNVLHEIPSFAASQLPEGTLKKNLANSVSELEALAEPVGAAAEVQYGHSYTAILQYAQEIGADLIVVASHRPGFQDYLLGSTAARVVRHAQCAVLVDR